MIQLSKRGVRRGVEPEEIAQLADEWRRCQFMRIPALFDRDLLSFAQTGARGGEYAVVEHTASGSELGMTSNSLIGTLDFLMNSPELVRLAETVTGCGHIGAFFGRIYRLMPGTDQGHDWHGDIQHGRQLGVSVNITEGVFEGGLLQLRDVASGRILSELSNTGPGDCVIFRLGDDIEHRVLPVTGPVMRQAYAGWFQRKDYAKTLKG